jgi:transposase-like protein
MSFGTCRIFNNTYKNFTENKSIVMITIFDINEKTKTVQHSVSYALEIGLINEDKNCETCGEPLKMIRNIRKRDGWIWRCKTCKSESSIRNGTWFSNSRLPIRTIIMVIYFWAHKYTQKQVQHELGLSKHTTVNWFNYLREKCFVSQRNTIIGGPGKIVQIDESKFGKRKFNKGKRVEGIWVFGGIEVYEDKSIKPKAFMVPVENRSASTLMAVIKARIRPGTTIYSDLWKSYNTITEEGYQHGTVNHSKEFKSSSGVHTNNIEGLWGEVKRSAFPRNGSVKHHYTSYFSEFLWRKTVRGDDLFLAAVSMINNGTSILDVGIEESEDASGFQLSMYDVLTDNGESLKWSEYNARCEGRRILKDADFFIPNDDLDQSESDNLLSQDSEYLPLD